MVTDPISDLIIRIKNAGEAGKESIVFPYSKLTENVAFALEKNGYLKSVSKKGKKINKCLEIELLYIDKRPRVEGVERVSKLSKRIYQKAKDLRLFRSGYGNLVLSTPKGILTDTEAKKQNVGGEVLFKIW